ncbi:hypothetical protein [Streptomyces sp. NPDC051569]|uniref:hypothetical protein n=1 Tax=Streptomyces sp. NPDC051569 TaxID=3365661 RepID=UPI0037A13114
MRIEISGGTALHPGTAGRRGQEGDYRMKGDRHSKSDVEQALRRAEAAGLKVTHDQNGHRWGYVICCPCSASTKVWSTPANAGTEGKKIDEFTRRHRACG